MENALKQTVDYLNDQGVPEAEIGIILGTGLGKMIQFIEIIKEIEYSSIPNFPVATVEFHQSRLIYGKLHDKLIIAMQGRFHYYEGYSMQQITFPVRVMKLLGIRYLLLSNAAGAMNLMFKKGELMLIEDHISFLPDNPLRGQNLDELGPRFPDMSRPYSEFLNEKLVKIAKRNNIALHRGVYVAVTGPNLETRAEYRMFRNFADAVGMSTVPEVIAANHMGLPCAAVSVLTDECDPDNLQAADINDIIKTAGRAEVHLNKLFTGLIKEL
ncbi:MAG: purine-nucleoside phosphorylase [Bacteroidales bacterium]|nr:purine-nucleoside phosphorylase [Bacteroidales bacterium]